VPYSRDEVFVELITTGVVGTERAAIKEEEDGTGGDEDSAAATRLPRSFDE